jgi:sugar lactone lactonase YvrE
MPAANALLNNPQGLAVDSASNLYIADTGNNVVRKISISTGYIIPVAGNGIPGNSGDTQLALAAQLNAPVGVAVDSVNNVYIADSGNHRVRFVNILTGVITAFAGTGTAGFNGDLIGPLAAQLNNPTYLALDSANTVYINDTKNGRVRKVPTNGFIVTVAGGSMNGLAPIAVPNGIAVDAVNSLYIADSGNSRMLKVLQNQSFSIIGGTGAKYYLGPDGNPASVSQLSKPEGMAVDATNNLYVTDWDLGLVRKINPGGQIFSIATGAASPSAVALDSAGNLYVADSAGNRIIKVTSGVPTTIAGTGAAGYSPDGTKATSAMLSQPSGVAVDAGGNVYFSDTGNNVVRMINVGTGTLSTVPMGSGVQLNAPTGLTIDSTGILYIADTGSNRVRRMIPGAAVTNFAGTGVAGSSGDTGPATNAAINAPRGVVVDLTGNVYITDSASRIRKVSTLGIITTIAGTGVPGYSGDGGAATSAQFQTPWGIALDSSGNVYVSDSQASAVRMLTFIKTAPVTITSSPTLVQGMVGVSYAQVLAASGGTTPYNWSITAGSLPAGLSLSTTGTISGTPTAAGTSLFALVATDAASLVSAPVTFTMTVLPNNPASLTITTPSLVSGSFGIPYYQFLTAAGGQLPYNWSLASGTLPAGLSLSSAGIISGTPTGSGSSQFVARVTDANFATTTQSFTLTVVSAPLTHMSTFGQIAVGGTWDTKIYLTNVTPAPVALNLSFLSDSGTALPLPLVISQEGSTQRITSPTFSGVIDPNTTLIIDSGAGVQNLVTGWAEILSSDNLNGFAVFQTAASGTGSAGTSPLQTTAQAKVDLPYDNTGGYETDFALANLANVATTVNVAVMDAAGVNRWTYVLTLPANGHASFSVPNQFPATAGRQGLIQFQSSAGSLSGVGLQANTASGAFTSIPLILP